MENDKHIGAVWKALLMVGTIAAAVFAVDARYVTDTVFTEFKEGTVASLISRLDRIESKLDAVIAGQEK